MIKRAPLKKDPPGKCSRWHVVVYNTETKQKDWHTIRGTRDDAKALLRKFESAKKNGEYVGPPERKTFEEVANLFLDDRRVNNRRVSTLVEYHVFPSTTGTPLNKANVRKRVWMPLLERAQVRYRDMYSLRWTFVSLARASGEQVFNVARVIGHARSTIVDTIYGHTVDSALAGVSESVAERVGLTSPKLPAPPEPPSGPRQPPQLRVIDGGRRAGSENQRDGRKSQGGEPKGRHK
jgi:integrase